MGGAEVVLGVSDVDGTAFACCSIPNDDHDRVWLGATSRCGATSRQLLKVDAGKGQFEIGVW